MLTGVDLVHVPYKANYTTDLIGGQIPLAVAPMRASDRVHPRRQAARASR